MTRCAITLTLFAAALLLQTPAARTAPLDKDGCNRLKTEQGQLEQAGTRGHMGKGPQWAKTNLEPDKLEQVRRLLEVDEQLLFRCHGKPLVNLPKDSDPDPAAREPDNKDDAKEPAVKAGKAPKAQKKDAVKKDAERKPALKKAAAPPADQPAKGAAKPEAAPAAAVPAPKAGSAKTESTPENKPETKPEQKTAQKPAAKKTKAKPKVDDAYRPPAVEPGADPFAQQLAPKQ